MALVAGQILGNHMLTANEESELAFVCCRLRVLAEALGEKHRAYVDTTVSLLLATLGGNMSAAMIGARIKLAVSILQRRIAEITEDQPNASISR